MANEGEAFKNALKEIHAGRAEAHALWVSLNDEHQRDRFAFKASPWEGPGEYQSVSFKDGRNVFIKIGDRHLPVRKAEDK
ncbi:hypothetical protein HJB79_32055 [Rhizobium lentis]|uniref:hypothetical protein n=1 Tax=Rhizobium lentis TaxID=1138194 RepID=UPI001C83BACE|nr:hypothetical protein [Rhizobium lentis]MBX5143333.1 hypothetical protein [Rhizobium lentis]